MPWWEIGSNKRSTPFVGAQGWVVKRRSRCGSCEPRTRDSLTRRMPQGKDSHHSNRTLAKCNTSRAITASDSSYQQLFFVLSLPRLRRALSTRAATRSASTPTIPGCSIRIWRPSLLTSPPPMTWTRRASRAWHVEQSRCQQRSNVGVAFLPDIMCFSHVRIPPLRPQIGMRLHCRCRGLLRLFVSLWTCCLYSYSCLRVFPRSNGERRKFRRCPTTPRLIGHYGYT